ncbi:MAG: hypothetical protein RR547_04925, partial [Raoultibacter sp.]
MKRRLLAIVVIALSVCGLACCLWACAAQPQQPQAQEPVDQAQGEDEAERIKTLQGEEKVAAAQEYYAPKVTTAQDGTQIQKVPSDPFLWNTAILQGDDRGCTAAECHTSILDATQLLPMTHPKLWNPYNVEPTTKFCYMCHSKALFMQDSMHAIHMNSEKFKGDCNSCHYINPKTGKHELWDLVKYDTAYSGITSIPQV